MKTLLSALLVISFLLAAASCGSENDAAPPAFNTMSDAFAFDGDHGLDEKYYVYVFEKDGITYRAVAELPEDVSSEIWSMDLFDENFSEKAKEKCAPLKISRLENLNEGIPSQEELDKLIGKTGQELLDDGWVFWSWNLDTMEFGMYHGPYDFIVIFDGAVSEFDESQAGLLTVRSVTYNGTGNATDISLLESEG